MTASRFGKFYHFTSPDHLPRIVRDGFLKVTESNVGAPHGVGMRPAGEHVGPDVVWLLDRPELGDKSHGLTGSIHDKTAVRFTVRVRAFPWEGWEPARRMNARWRESMIRTAGGPAAARRWWVSTYPIALTEWKAIHVRDEFGEWEPVKF